MEATVSAAEEREGETTVTVCCEMGSCPAIPIYYCTLSVGFSGHSI
jgi:hypothetical protein